MCRLGYLVRVRVKVRVQGLVTFSGASLGTISYRFLDMCAVSVVGGGGAVKKNIYLLAWLGAIFIFVCWFFFGRRY